MEVPFDVMIQYLERRKRDLEECLHSLGSGNYSKLEKVGHQLKGNGSTFGLPELSQIGRRLEKAAASKNLNLARSLLNELTMIVNAKLN